MLISLSQNNQTYQTRIFQIIQGHITAEVSIIELSSSWQAKIDCFSLYLNIFHCLQNGSYINSLNPAWRKKSKKLKNTFQLNEKSILFNGICCAPHKQQTSTHNKFISSHFIKHYFALVISIAINKRKLWQCSRDFR